MSDINTTTDNTDPQNEGTTPDVQAEVQQVPDTEVPDSPAPEEVAEETAAPTLEELLLRDHKERVLGKDRISASQMASYLSFLGYDPDSDEPVNPLESPFIVDVLGEYDLDMWKRIALKGKSALGSDAKKVDEAYVDMWEEWRDEQSNRPPKSHMWLKGVVAAALLIAEHQGEVEQLKVEDVIAKEKAEAEKAAAEAAEKAKAEAEAKQAEKAQADADAEAQAADKAAEDGDDSDTDRSVEDNEDESEEDSE